MKTVFALALIGLAIVGLTTAQAQQGQQRQRRPEFAGDGAAQEHFQKQHEENQAFRQTLKDMAAGERLAAIKAHLQTQHQENLAFFAAQHDKRVARVRDNDRLSQAVKDELISFMDSQYQARIAFCKQMFQDTLAKLQELAANDGLARPERREAFHQHLAAKREQFRAFADQQREAFRAKLQELRGQRQRR